MTKGVGIEFLFPNFSGFSLTCLIPPPALSYCSLTRGALRLRCKPTRLKSTPPGLFSSNPPTKILPWFFRLPPALSPFFFSRKFSWCSAIFLPVKRPKPPVSYTPPPLLTQPPIILFPNFFPPSRFLPLILRCAHHQAFFFASFPCLD